MSGVAASIQSSVPDVEKQSPSAPVSSFADSEDKIKVKKVQDDLTEINGKSDGTVFSYGESGRMTPFLIGRMRNLNKPKTSMRTLSRWECVITEIDDQEFVAKVKRVYPEDAQDDGIHEDYAEFDMSDVNDSDRQFVKMGAIFYWSVGQAKSKAGTVEHKSMLVFPRLPAWSENTENRAKEKAHRAAKILGWGSSSSDAASQS